MRAQFTTPSDGILPFQWARPSDDTAAAASWTTYQQWEEFTSVQSPNNPDVAEINPNGVADALDSASPGSFSFITSSGNIYSPGGVIMPRAILPGYDLANATVDVLLQVRSQGQEIDIADVKIGGVSIDTLSNYSYHRLHEFDLGGEFGGIRVDHAWTFTVPADAASFQVDWGWNIVSASLDRLAIDTRATAGLPVAPGDLNDDGSIDADDIDILWHIVRNGGTDPNDDDTEDLNGDSFVNEDDVDYLLANLLDAGTGRAYGDADLDGGVGGLDFTAWRLRAGTGWANGDFDGDGGIGGLDFTLWRTRPTVYPADVGPHAGGLAAVPEPGTLVLLLMGLGAVVLRGRRVW